MATRTVTDCDVCGKEAKAERIRIETGSSYNGVETLPEAEDLDLCPKCCAWVLRKLIKFSLKADRQARYFVSILQNDAPKEVGR